MSERADPEIDSVLTFLAKGRVFVLGEQSYAIVDVRYGGAMTVRKLGGTVDERMPTSALDGARHGQPAGANMRSTFRSQDGATAVICGACGAVDPERVPVMQLGVIGPAGHRCGNCGATLLP